MMGTESPRGKSVGDWLWGSLDQWLTKESISPLEYQDIGGLGDVQSGLDQMKQGKAKSKLVVRIE